jgi:hypothetical protein
MISMLLAHQALASSHREAPAIALDPSADLTDFYAFVNPNDSSKVVFILNVNPLEPAGSGPNFHRFDDTVRYNIKCDNEGDGREDVTFNFRFATTYAYPNEFLYNLGDISDPANLNHQQTYTVTAVRDGVLVGLLGTGRVAPANVGTASDPTGAYAPTSTSMGSITADYTSTNAQGHRFFAGPRQESFFVDLEDTFDLLNLGAPNFNTLLGYNVHSIAMEIDAASLTRDGQAPSSTNGNEVLACWSTTERRARRVNQTDGTTSNAGAWVQVARLGMPLVNEVAIPVGDKDLFNASRPLDDGQFLSYVTDPILPFYMDAILGIPEQPPFDAGLGIGGREDLVLAFLTGLPGVNMPSGYALGGNIPGEPGKTFGAFEALRVNLTLPSGFPNGRLPADDVTDVALSVMGGLLIDGTVVSDGVDATGLTFPTEFPFLGDPWAGNQHPQNFHE